MNKKLFLLSFLIFFSTPSRTACDFKTTTVALTCGILATYFSKPLFYHNPDGKLEVATNQTRALASYVKKFITKKNRDLKLQEVPLGQEMDNYIRGFRLALGIFTFCAVKLLYKI